MSRLPQPVEPRPAATVLLVRDGVGGVEVLMGRRPLGGAFGGLWVFPGGAVEEADRSPLAKRAVSGATDEGSLPWMAAALRETGEEVGLLLTDRPVPPLPDGARGEQLYRWVLDHAGSLDASRLLYLSNWVTPVGAPRRFDTRFYLACLDGEAPAVTAREELEEVRWVRPGEVLAPRGGEAWPLILPTEKHLELLVSFPDTSSLVEFARRRTVRRMEPLLTPEGPRLPTGDQP